MTKHVPTKPTPVAEGRAPEFDQAALSAAEAAIDAVRNPTAPAAVAPEPVPTPAPATAPNPAPAPAAAKSTK